jgi:hypothetical protein
MASLNKSCHTSGKAGIAIAARAFLSTTITLLPTIC